MARTNLVEIAISDASETGKLRASLRLEGELAHLGVANRDFELDLHALANHADPHAYGIFLGNALFAPNVLGQAYQNVVAFCSGRDEALRIRLFIESENAEIWNVAWERIQTPDGETPALDAKTPFARFIETAVLAPFHPLRKTTLRMLAVIASPDDLADEDLDPITNEERRALHEVLEDLASHLSITWLDSADPDNRPHWTRIREELIAGYDLVHFLCHGAMGDTSSSLVLEDEDDKCCYVEATDIVEAFTLSHTPPALCLLTACDSARVHEGQAFVSLGPHLLARGGAGAVIAMSDRIDMATASTFTSHFYERLIEHGVVDQAVNEARSLIHATWDWSVPVLLMRCTDGQLLARIREAANNRQIPDLPTYYVERMHVESQLRDLLVAPADQLKVALLYGLAGHGKTLVARSVAHQLQDQFPDGTLWADVTTSQVNDILWRFIQVYDTAIEREELVGRNAFKTRLSQVLANKHTLIVLEEVSESTPLDQLLPAECPQVVVLLVSNQKLLDYVPDSNTRFVPEMTATEAIQLFRKVWHDRYQDVADSVLETLADRLRFSPARIRLAAQDILQRQMDPGDYIVELDRNEPTVDPAFETLFAGLYRSAQRLLPFVGVMTGDTWRQEALATVSQFRPNEVETGLRQLITQGLVSELPSGQYRTSPVVRDFAQAKLQEIGGEPLVRTAQSLLSHYYLNVAREQVQEARAQLLQDFLKDDTRRQEFEDCLHEIFLDYVSSPSWLGLGMAIVPDDLVQTTFEQVVLGYAAFAQKWEMLLDASGLSHSGSPLESALLWAAGQEDWRLVRRFAAISGGQIRDLVGSSDEGRLLLGIELRFGTLLRSVLTDASLESTLFRAVRINHAVWEGCEVIEANWLGVVLENCTFDDVDLADAQMPGTAILSSVLTAVDARRVNLRGAVVIESILDNVKLRKADLSDAIFYRCTLTDLDLRSASLKGVRLIDCCENNLNLAGVRDQPMRESSQ